MYSVRDAEGYYTSAALTQNALARPEPLWDEKNFTSGTYLMGKYAGAGPDGSFGGLFRLPYPKDPHFFTADVCFFFFFFF